MAKRNSNAQDAPQKAGDKFILSDRFQRVEPETHETDLIGDELNAFVTKMRNAYAIENFLDPVNVMIMWD